MFENVRAVVFDAVGTLLHAAPPVASVYHDTGRRHGSALSTSNISRRLKSAMAMHFPGQSSSEELERARWSRVVADTFSDVADTSALFEELWQHFARAEHWHVAAEVGGLWQRLRASGYMIVVASNFDARLIEISEQLDPLNEADAVFVSSLIGHSKPDREFFRAIEQSLYLTSDELLMIGDDPVNDCEGAQQAGWQSLLLDHNTGADCRHVISSLREIANHLDI